MMKNQTIDAAVGMATDHELIKFQIAAQGSIAAVRRDPQEHSPRKPQVPHGHYCTQTTSPSKSSGLCGNCGYDGARSHKDNKCPAKDAKCQYCHKRGYFEHACHRKKHMHNVSMNQVVANQEPGKSTYSGPDPNYYFLWSVNGNSDIGLPWMVYLEIKGTNLNFKIDSGADVSVTSKRKDVRIIPQPHLNTWSIQLECDSVFMATIKRHQRDYKSKIHVISHARYK